MVLVLGLEFFVEGVNVVDCDAEFGVHFMDDGEGVEGGGGEGEAHGIAHCGSDETGI